MGKLGAAMILAVTLGAGTAGAEDRLVVVELFTSQGCSSCPPADEILRDLAGMPGILPLALHVDYWDYIGWADSFAQGAFTRRQESYAHVAGQSTIYTPQMIIGGQDAVVGAHGMAVMAAVNAHAALTPVVSLELTRQADQVRIALRNTGAVSGPLLIQLVRFIPDATVEIGRGENAGRTLTYANVVTDWQVVGQWDGVAPLTLEAPVAGDDNVAVLVQEVGPGLILAAARLD